MKRHVSAQSLLPSFHQRIEMAAMRAAVVEELDHLDLAGKGGLSRGELHEGLALLGPGGAADPGQGEQAQSLQKPPTVDTFFLHRPRRSSFDQRRA